MRTTKIYHLSLMDVYLQQNCEIFFAGVRKNTCQTRGIHCKEVIGKRCVNKGLNKILIKTNLRWTDEQALALQTKLRDKHKTLKVAPPKVWRVKGHPNKILIEVSPRWSRNSVAHSYLTTLIRMYAHDVLGWEREVADVAHLKKAAKIVKLINKFGLRLFDIHPTKRYDVGMVNLTWLLIDYKNIVDKHVFGLISEKLTANHPYKRLEKEYRKRQ